MIEALCHRNTGAIDLRIKDILARGNIVVFKTGGGLEKFVREWNQDSDGDLTAYFSTGALLYVCPYALLYTIGELTPEEAQARILSLGGRE
jgi:hypothetical protein